MSTSSAWNFFKKPERGQDFAECKICTHSIKNKGGNTSNLIQHLWRVHPSQYGAMTPSGQKSAQANDSSPVLSAPEVIQPTVKSLFASSTPLTSGNNHHESIADAITYFLWKDNVLFNAVSPPGFQKLLKILEPRYKIPDQTTFSKNKVAKLYDVTREAVMSDLSRMDYFTSTTDMWSSHSQTLYMGDSCCIGSTQGGSYEAETLERTLFLKITLPNRWPRHWMTWLCSGS